MIVLGIRWLISFEPLVIQNLEEEEKWAFKLIRGYVSLEPFGLARKLKMNTGYLGEDRDG